jgi:6-pyruvoyl-tetrahydropterin synthase related domain
MKYREHRESGPSSSQMYQTGGGRVWPPEKNQSVELPPNDGLWFTRTEHEFHEIRNPEEMPENGNPRRRGSYVCPQIRPLPDNSTIKPNYLGKARIPTPAPSSPYIANRIIGLREGGITILTLMSPVAIASGKTIRSGRQTALHLAWLTVVALVLTWPVLLHGIPDLSHDGIMHATWTKPFAEQFWGGELYPRWLSNTNGGFGSAPFFVYPALPTYVSALVAPLVGNHDPRGWILAGISCAIAMLLSGYAAYFWLRDLSETVPALFASALYLLMPYHTAIDLYNRGAEAELWSFVAVPLVLWSVQAIVHGKRWGFVGVAASYALLVQSHLPIALTFSLVPLLQAYFLSESGRWRALLVTTGAMAFGGALAAVYLIPAVVDKKTVHMGDAAADPSFNYSNSWLFERAPLFDFRTRLLVLTTSTLLFAAIMWWSSSRFLTQRRRRVDYVFYAAIGLGAYLMMTQIALPIWKYVRPLQYVLFPMRFNVVLAAATAALAALALSTLGRASRVVLVASGVIILLWFGADYSAALNAFSAWRHVPDQRRQTNARSIELLLDNPLEWPKTSNMRDHNLPEFERFLSQHPPKQVKITDVRGQPLGNASVKYWRPREVHLQVQAAQDGILHINHFYYPTWQARIEESGQELPVQYDADGLLQIPVRTGTYTVKLLLEKSPAEKFGIIISFCFLLLLVALGLLSATGRTPSFLTCRTRTGGCTCFSLT